MSNFYVSQGYYILKKNVYDTDSFYDNHETVISDVIVDVRSILCSKKNPKESTIEQVSDARR